jgi:hypothetical protein
VEQAVKELEERVQKVTKTWQYKWWCQFDQVDVGTRSEKTIPTIPVVIKTFFLFRDLGLCVKNFNSAVDNLPGIMKMWKRQDQDTNLVAPVKNGIKAAPSLS